MSYDLMSDDTLRDEIAKIEAVLRARLVVQHQDREERRKAQEEAEEKQALARLKPYIDKYKTLEKLCENPITLKATFTVPVEVKAEVYLSIESDPDEIDQMDIDVSMEFPDTVSENSVTAIQDAVSDAIGEMDNEELAKFFGKSSAVQDIIDRKQKLYDELDETDYDISDLADAAANQE